MVGGRVGGGYSTVIHCLYRGHCICK